jgi:hypothetical protein
MGHRSGLLTVMKEGVRDAMTMSNKELILINVFVFTLRNLRLWRLEESNAWALQFTRHRSHACSAPK